MAIKNQKEKTLNLFRATETRYELFANPLQSLYELEPFLKPQPPKLESLP